MPGINIIECLVYFRQSYLKEVEGETVVPELW